MCQAKYVAGSLSERECVKSLRVANVQPMYVGNMA